MIKQGEVTALSKEGSIFVARCGDRQIRARSILMATGLVDERPDVEGLRAAVYEGAIRFCPICDGYEAMDRRIGVLGSWKAAGSKALFLRTYTREMFIFATDEENHAPSGMREALSEAGVKSAGKAVRVEPMQHKVAVTTRDGTRYELDVLYPALGCDVRSDLAKALGAKCNEIGTLLVDDHQRTSVPGLYAAGDVVTDLH